MAKKPSIFQSDESSINCNNNGQPEYIDYMPGFETETRLDPESMENGKLEFEDDNSHGMGKKYELGKQDIFDVMKYVNKEDIPNLIKVSKKTTGINYMAHVNFDNTKDCGTVFKMQTHVIYTGLPDAPCQFIQDYSDEIEDERMKIKHVIKGNPFQNANYFECEIYVLYDKGNPNDKILIGFSKEIPKDIFNCIMYFIKVKGLKGSDDLETGGLARIRHPSYHDIKRNSSHVYLDESDFATLTSRDNYEVEVFNARNVLIQMMLLPSHDAFRERFINEFDNSVSINGVIIKRPVLEEIDFDDIDILKPFGFKEVGSKEISTIFGCDYSNKEIVEDEFNEFLSPFTENDDLNAAYSFDCYISVAGSPLREKKERSAKIILLNKNVYSTVVIANRDKLVPINYSTPMCFGDKYTAVSLIKETNIFLMSKNFETIDNLLGVGGVSVMITGYKKYEATNLKTVMHFKLPLDLFYLQYKAVSIYGYKCNGRSVEDEVMSKLSLIPFPIEDFTCTEYNEIYKYPPSKVVVDNEVYQLFGKKYRKLDGYSVIEPAKNKNKAQKGEAVLINVPGNFKKKPAFGFQSAPSSKTFNYNFMGEPQNNLTLKHVQSFFIEMDNNNNNGTNVFGQLPNENKQEIPWRTGFPQTNHGGNGGGLFGRPNNNGWNNGFPQTNNNGGGLFGQPNNNRGLFGNNFNNGGGNVGGVFGQPIFGNGNNQSNYEEHKERNSDDLSFSSSSDDEDEYFWK